MVTVRGDLAAWLSREWLTSRNLHGPALPESSGECDPHRAQLVTATGLTEGDDGDKLLWCELSDGDLWIDACIPTTVVDQYNATTAIPFTASSRSKCLFALLSWRFVLARPPVPQRTSPSKRRAAAASASAVNEPKVELLSRRVCLRVDAFKHHALGEGSLVNERMKPFRRTAQGANGASAVSNEDEERVMWVRRVEEAGGVQQKKEENKDEQVTYVTDLPADPALRLAPRASSSVAAAAPPPPPSASAAPSTHAPIARSDQRLPPYVPHPSWPADDAPMVSAPSREDMQACLRRAREEKLAKAGRASAGGAAAKSTAAPLRDAAHVAGGSRSSSPTTTKEEGATPGAWQPAPVDSAAMQACLAAAKAKAKPLQGPEPATPAAPAHGRSAQPAPASAPSASFAAAFVAPDQDALRATLTAARDKARLAKQRASLVPAAASAAATSEPSSTTAPSRKRPRESAPAEVGAWSSAAALLAHKGSTAPAAAPSNAVLVAPNAPSVPFPRDTCEDSILSQALDGDEHAQYAASTCPPSSPPPSSPQKKSPAQRTASPAATLLPPPSSPHHTSPAPINSAHSSPPASSAQTVRARKHSRSPAPPPSSLPALPIFDEDDADSVTGLDEDGAGAMMHPAQDAARKTKGWPESAVKAFAPAPARPAATRPPAAAKRAPAPAQAQADERAGKRVKLSQPLQQQQRDDNEALRVDERPTTTTLVPRRKPLIPLDVWDFDAWKRSRQDRRTTM
ncbi:hypothetical protein Rhopal_003961-T1 [Rhodotorula paludigena]|uniref:Telomere replication protein EST3 n=1 Tax=Rhodotorula paludigena TaxID=86838 RepID=A0AAV5GN77_9BASI|nr:hypothetical protein Rhopal_003961-T1 [Rhodotorula paludigena]